MSTCGCAAAVTPSHRSRLDPMAVSVRMRAIFTLVWDWHYQIAEFWFVVAMVQQDDRRSWIYKAAARRPN